MLQILPARLCGSTVTINGYEVPRVEVMEQDSTGRWHVTYDGRYGIMAENLEELQRWLWIVANAEAVGAGYSCHGEHSIHRPNPYRRKVMCIGSVEKTATDTRED